MDLRYPTFPHQIFVKMKTVDTEEMDKWCVNHLGEQGVKWDCYFASDNLYNYDMYYAFIEHKYAMVFSLTWT